MQQQENKGTVVVTIGLCVKDSERTIKETIISILNQNFEKKRMEVIVIDDGCRDRTMPILIELFSKSSLKVRIYSTSGAGLTIARQMVIDNSCANLVVFIDGDMIFSKDFLQKQVELMEKNPSIGVSQGIMRGKKSESIVAELEDLSCSGDYEIGIHRTWRRNPQALGTGGSIFRVDAMKAAGGFDARIKGAAEDADLTARIKLAGYSLSTSNAIFEHEFKKTLKTLWKQYSWYGYGMHYFYHKHGKLNSSVLINFWPISYVWSAMRAILVFRITHRKIAFFLPSYNFFRSTAWWYGFFRGHQDGYGHEFHYRKMNETGN